MKKYFRLIGCFANTSIFEDEKGVAILKESAFDAVYEASKNVFGDYVRVKNVWLN